MGLRSSIRKGWNSSLSCSLFSYSQKISVTPVTKFERSKMLMVYFMKNCQYRPAVFRVNKKNLTIRHHFNGASTKATGQPCCRNLSPQCVMGPNYQSSVGHIAEKKRKRKIYAGNCSTGQHWICRFRHKKWIAYQSWSGPGRRPPVAQCCPSGSTPPRASWGSVRSWAVRSAARSRRSSPAPRPLWRARRVAGRRRTRRNRPGKPGFPWVSLSMRDSYRLLRKPEKRSEWPWADMIVGKKWRRLLQNSRRSITKKVTVLLKHLMVAIKTSNSYCRNTCDISCRYFGQNIAAWRSTATIVKGEFL